MINQKNSGNSEKSTVIRIRQAMTNDDIFQDAMDSAAKGVRRVIFSDPQIEACWKQRIAALK
jgi:hypothetical protein